MQPAANAAPPALVDGVASFLLRAGHEGDHAFIKSAWAKSNIATALGRALGPKYADEHRVLIDSALTRAMVHQSIVVAHVPDESDAILGFLVREPFIPLVHYVYVRGEMRRHGIARAMIGDLAKQDVIYTHRITDSVHHKGNLFELPKTWHFNPYPFLRGIS